MKRFRLLLSLLIVLAFTISGCSHKVYRHKPLPPGHAKKIYGSKSAKHHAPGHKKAHYHKKKHH